MKTSLIIVLLIILILAGGVGGYFLLYKGKNNPYQSSSLEVSYSEPTPTTTATAFPLTEEIREITISAQEYSFTPASLTIKAGEKVKIIFQNKGKMQHDWVLEGTKVRSKVIKPGEEEAVELSLDKPGEYTYYCSIAGHRNLGMEGKLIVE